MPEEKLQLEIRPFPIPDNIPDQDEITRALLTMKMGKSPGPSQIRVEDMRKWLEMEREMTNPQPEAWNNLVEIVQEAFRTGKIPEALTNAVLVLIPKNEVNQFRGIGLLEVVWKLIASIINKRLMRNIEFHDGIHGFRPGRGTGTATLEAKLLMQMAACKDIPLYQVFLDLTKAYDTLDRGRTIEILKTYGTGPNTIRLLERYWLKNFLVPKQSGFFGAPFQAHRGVTQGDIISPCIFNIVIDAVLQTCYTRVNPVLERAVLPEISANLYADDGLIAGFNAKQVQHELSIITELFAKVGLNMNATKTKSMVMVGARQYHSISDEAYERRMKGTGESYKTRMSRLITCPECDKEMRMSHLKTHLSLIHNKVQETEYPDITQAEPRSFTVSMDRSRMKIACPVPECPGGGSDRHNLRRHFMFRHPNDIIIIEQEGKLPRCERCCMFVSKPHAKDNDLCLQGAEKKEKIILDARRTLAKGIRFHIQGQEVEDVADFKYLGRWLSDNDSDLKAIRSNIKKAQAKWASLSRLFVRQGANVKMMAQFYLTVVQNVLLFGAETWTLTERELSLLSSFHNRCVRGITRRWIKLDIEEGRFECPDMRITFEQAGLERIEKYISKRKATITPYAKTRALYRKCLMTKKTPSSAHKVVWWS